MYNLGDDSELDRLSRDAAGRYQHPGKPNWQQMEAELDKVLPTTRKRRFNELWLLPVLLAAGGAVYWLSTGQQATDKAIVTTAPVENIEPKKTQPEPAVTNPAATQTIQEQKTSVAQKHTRANTGQNNVSSPFPKTASGASMAIPPVIVKNSNPSVGKSLTAAEAGKLLSSNDPDPGKNTSANKTIQNKKNTIEPAAGVTTTTTTETGNNNIDNTSTTEKKAKEEAPSSQPGSSLFKEPAPFGKGWSIGFLAGIDKSTVKFAYNSGAGFNAGITLGYHLNTHFSFHTGAIYTHKKYKMEGYDFTPPKGSWASYYKLENVDGDCSMWEVPILVRYSFTPHGRNSFFLSTGLSSYFMTHENYSYFYYNNNNQPMTRSMDYKSDDKHILSILDFSAGYENRLSEKMSLIIEPYAKLPLGGIGLGNIQLSSFGVNFSLQLRQPAHK